MSKSDRIKALEKLVEEQRDYISYQNGVIARLNQELAMRKVADWNGFPTVLPPPPIEDRTRDCPCRPENGGSGICGCVLGGPQITCSTTGTADPSLIRPLPGLSSDREFDSDVIRYVPGLSSERKYG